MEVLIKPILLQCALICFQSIIYFWVQNSSREAHNVLGVIDQRICYAPKMIYIYVLWYPLIFLYPIVLYGLCRIEYYVYIAAVLTDIAVSTIIYYFYPTYMERPEAYPKGFTGTVIKAIRKGNYKGRNCMPSMHCSMSFIIIISSLSSVCLGGYFKAVLAVISVLIIISTVFTKQHAFKDAAAALPTSVICFVFGKMIIDLMM